MSDATLWINDTNGTAAVKKGSAIYTMPLWAFEEMRDIIAAEAEKKVEVTYRDFDIQQELLDRYRADNRKLRELVGIMRTCIEHACLCDFCPLFAAEDMDEPRCIADMDSRMCELGIEVNE